MSTKTLSPRVCARTSREILREPSDSQCRVVLPADGLAPPCAQAVSEEEWGPRRPPYRLRQVEIPGWAGSSPSKIRRSVAARKSLFRERNGRRCGGNLHQRVCTAIASLAVLFACARSADWDSRFDRLAIASPPSPSVSRLIDALSVTFDLAGDNAITAAADWRGGERVAPLGLAPRPAAPRPHRHRFARLPRS